MSITSLLQVVGYDLAVIHSDIECYKTPNKKEMVEEITQLEHKVNELIEKARKEYGQ